MRQRKCFSMISVVGGADRKTLNAVTSSASCCYIRNGTILCSSRVCKTGELIKHISYSSLNTVGHECHQKFVIKHTIYELRQSDFSDLHSNRMVWNILNLNIMCLTFHPLSEERVKKNHIPLSSKQNLKKRYTTVLFLLENVVQNQLAFYYFHSWPSSDPYGTNNNIESSPENILAGSACECFLFVLSISLHPNEFSNILPSCQQRYLVWAQGASRVAVWPAPTTMAACPASRDSSCIWRESGWSKLACAWLLAHWAFTARAPQRETHAQVRLNTKAFGITRWILEGTKRKLQLLFVLRYSWIFLTTK